MVGRKVVWAVMGTLLARGAGEARADFPRDLAQDCRTISAFDGAPSQEALRKALARVGANGRTRLDLSGPVEDATPAPSEDDGIRPTSSAPRLPPRRWTLSPEAARAIADAPTMGKATALVLDHDLIAAQAARFLASSPRLGAIESLSLRDTRMTAAALHELLAPGAFPALAALDLGGNRLRPADLRELAARLAERKVRRLSLGRHSDWDWRFEGVQHGKPMLSRSAEAAAALAQVAATPGLATLDLADEPVGYAELEALFQISRQESLEIVTAAPFGRFSRKQMEGLAALDPQGRLTLSIVDDSDSPAALRALERSGLLAKTVALEVVCGDVCARLLARSANTARLRELVLSCEENVPFTRATAEALSKAVGLGSLRKLALFNEVELCKAEGIGGGGLRALLKAPFAPQLESLRLEDQGLGSAGYLELAKAKRLAALKELLASEWEAFMTPEVARWLLRDGPLAPHLEVLRLGSEGQISIANLPGTFDAPRLRVLEIQPTTGSIEEWHRFVGAPWLRKLQILRTDVVQLDEAEPGHDELAKDLKKSMAPGACFF
jgi:hypothetical protein